MTNFDDLKLAVEALSGGMNTVNLDDLGMPSVLVPFPKLKYSDVLDGGTQEPLPAFVVDGQEKDVIYVSKYQNIIVNDRAYSLPMRDPATNLNFDRALEVCRNKGAGWHLTTNALWAAIALWCKKNGTMPHGNNNYGQDINFAHEKGVPTYKSGATINRTATGSGPVTWYHNYDTSGIADLNGNVWEWVSGLRLNNSEIQIIPYGNAMKHDSNMSALSTEWKAIMPDGTLVNPDTVGTVKYTTAYPGVNFASIVTVPAATGGANLLEALGLIPHAGSVPSDYGNNVVWFTLAGETFPLRGGYWLIGEAAGVFTLNLYSPRSETNSLIGFRSAFVS